MVVLAINVSVYINIYIFIKIIVETANPFTVSRLIHKISIFKMCIIFACFIYPTEFIEWFINLNENILKLLILIIESI